jgi:glycosyltransferase involved in cell wall biosynthesis
VTTVAISVDQLRRPQPGGIGTYVRGLLAGMQEHHDEWTVQEVGPPAIGGSRWGTFAEKLRGRYYAERWASSDLGVAPLATVIHATSFTGPFGSPRAGIVRSVTLQDFVWRDQPESTTARGREFHESRFQLIRQRQDIRIFVTTAATAERVAAEGVDPTRIFEITLGLDRTSDVSGPAASRLLAAHGITGPFTLCAGTIEPRKNLPRLLEAHRVARQLNPELGPLVVVGPRGWGDVALDGAISLGPVDRGLLTGLLARASVVAYVPLAEGWGLPPLEALNVGTRVVASSTVPSVLGRSDVVVVEALSVEGIAEGLQRAIALPDDEAARADRRFSVASLTWGAMAEQHIAGWQ